MEEEDECIHGVLDLVNGVARQLLAKELFPYLPTAAQVAQKRIQLYELLLEGGPTDSERMLQLFARARQELEAEAEDGEGERENVENLLVLLEPPMASEPPEEVPVDIEDIENREPMPTFRLLKPRPFGLEDSDAECDRFSLLENRKPKILRSLDQMQVEMEERPLELEPPCKFLPPKLVIEPKGSPSDRYKPKISKIGGLAEAMRRVWKDKEEPTGEPPRVPDFRREEEPPAEEEPEYVVESKLSRVFITDLMTTMDIRGLVDPGMQLFFIEEAVCVEHLKRAAAGIASESIMPCPEDPDSLTVIPNLNIRDVAPARVETFAQNFLLSGRAFRRLNARVNFERDAMSPVQRPVHRTLRDAIVDILSNCREFMLNINCKKVIELEHCCSQSTLVIQHLNQMFENEPRLHFEGDVTGSFILSCIRLAIDNCNNITYLQLLLYLLHCICRTYFYQLKRWLYLGEVDEKFNEIFIARSEIGSPTLMDECSREFFERGFQVKKELVPWFLRGCEDEIMKCGKYNQLLRAYNPQHPIFEVEFPEMLICFDEKMQRAERRKLMKQFSALYEHFGACSMQSIMEERMNAKRKFKNIMLERTRAHIAEWEERQKVLQEEADFRKKLYYEDLNAQQELQAQARLEKRRQEVIDELNFEKERNRLEDMRLEREKLQLQETVDQLQEELDAREEFKEESSPDQSDRSFVSCQDGLEFQLDLGLENIEERTEKEEEEEENASELEASSSTLVPYQRSVSDVLNSNEVNQTELDRNRQAMHSSEQFHECQTWVQLKSSGSGITVTNMPSDINANLSEELTDLERNRLRMNQHDPFNNFNSTVDEHVKRMQCQVASTTERAQNRRRVMDCEYNIFLAEDSKNPSEELMGEEEKLSQISEREQNRRRVMESEFNILAGKNSKEPSEESKGEEDNLTETTEREQNRRRVMGSEYNIIAGEDSKEPSEESLSLPLEFNNKNEEKQQDQQSTERARNKRRVMASEYDFIAGEDWQKTSETSSGRSHSCPTSPMCSEREQNRRRVMDCEYDIILGQEFKKPPEKSGSPSLELNKEQEEKPHAPISEREKNRRRVMGSEYDIVLREDLKKQQESVDLPPGQNKPHAKEPTELTERARNKRRVMECEYNIIFGEKTKKPCEKSMSLPLQPHMLQVEVTLPTPTPMSTTSDGAIGGLTPKNYTDDIDSDPANNNNHSDENYDTTTSHIPQKASTSKRPIFRGGLPTNPVLTCSPNENNEYYETMETPVEIPDVNPYIVHRCLKMCVMNPVNAYYSLLRNEVLKIFQECRIYDHFRKLRDYFFLLDGQFGTRLTGEILGKIDSGMDPRSLCQKGVLDSILNNALANNTTDETTVCQNLTLNCKTIPETLNIMSLEATSMLMLHCKMDWPLNLVISPETIVRYGNIFGYLLKVRHVSHVLEETYLYLNQLPKLLSPELRAALHYRHLQMIRHKLAHFLTSLQTHLVAKALQSSWQKFKEQLVGANSIEGLYQQHVIYLKQVAFIAHLNRGGAKVRETIEKIFLIVLRFCKVLQSQSFVIDDENRFVHPRFKRLIQEEAEFNKFMQYLIYLSDKAYASGYQEEIGDLISVINFNKYYKVAEEESVS